MTIEELKTLIINTLCHETLMLTPEDVAAIEAIEKTYLKEEFVKILQ